MTNTLPAPPIEITRTIREKIFIISWTWFLLIFVYQNILYGFVEDLNRNGKVNFGTGFSSYQIIWGEHIFPNVLKLIIDVVIALLGGITVGYLLTRARITFKFFYSFFSTAIQLFIYLLIMLIVVGFAQGGNVTENLGQTVFYIFESLRLQPLQGAFLLVSMALVFLGYYYGINFGMRLKEENAFDTDVDTRSTFLDVKWYHWLWFWIPVGIYLKSTLWLIYGTIVAIWEILKKTKWFEFFGVSTSGDEPRDSIGGTIFWGYIAVVIALWLLYFVWEILSGRRTFKNKFISFLVVFFFSFIVPLLFALLFYWLANRK